MGSSTGAAQTQSGIILGHGSSMANLKWLSTREAPVVALRVANDSWGDFMSESALFLVHVSGGPYAQDSDQPSHTDSPTDLNSVRFVCSGPLLGQFSMRG